MTQDYFNARDVLATSHGDYVIYRLEKLEQAGLTTLAKLPFSIRVMLESVLRQCNELEITQEDVRNLAKWKPRASHRPRRCNRLRQRDGLAALAVVNCPLVETGHAALHQRRIERAQELRRADRPRLGGELGLEPNRFSDRLIHIELENEGSHVVGDLLSLALPGDDDLIGTGIAMAVDVSERRTAEDGLKAILNAPMMSITLLDLDGRVLLINSLAGEEADLTAEDAVGRRVIDLWDRDIAAARHDRFLGVLASGDPDHFEDAARCMRRRRSHDRRPELPPRGGGRCCGALGPRARSCPPAQKGGHGERGRL